MMVNKNNFIGLLLACLFFCCSLFAQEKVPGIVVDHQPPSSGQYIGSPSLVILPNGDYVASHDLFGDSSAELSQAITKVFLSTDKGETWKQVSTIRGAFWNSLFFHKGNLYLLGPDRTYGSVMIRKSKDEGRTWTVPYNRQNGVLLSGEYHCAPMPVIEYKGRLWRPMETAYGPKRAWGKRFGAMVMSAPVNADLMKAGSWKTTIPLLYDSTYLKGNFGGWLEGNFVVDQSGNMIDMLRVDDRSTLREKAALVHISQDGKSARFDPLKDFIDFPGGSKKFVVKYDSVSHCYWTLVNVILEKYVKENPQTGAADFRNVLMLRKSEDLRKWEDVKIILEHRNVLKSGFQYPDFSFDGEDLILLSRTAFFDGREEVPRAHDADFLTFHRIRDFRSLQAGK